MEDRYRVTLSPFYMRDRICLCSPSSDIVDLPIERLTKVRYKSIHATHIFIVPHRRTYLWRRKVYYSCSDRFVIKS